MLNITTKEVPIEEELETRIKFICDFCNVTPTIINGSIHSINKTNINYVEPHRIIIKDNLYLAFNYSNEIYVNNLSKKIKISPSFYNLSKQITKRLYLFYKMYII